VLVVSMTNADTVLVLMVVQFEHHSCKRCCRAASPYDLRLGFIPTIWRIGSRLHARLIRAAGGSLSMMTYRLADLDQTGQLNSLYQPTAVHYQGCSYHMTVVVVPHLPMI